METTLLGFLLVHPNMTIPVCLTVVALGVCGYLSVRRFCDAIERVANVHLRGGKTRAEAAAVPMMMTEAPAQKMDEGKRIELESALKSLGYKTNEIEKAMGKLDMGNELPVLIRKALAVMPNRARAS